MNVTLPSGVLYGGVLYKTARIDAIRIKQQKYLQDFEDIKAKLAHIPKLLSDLILELISEDGNIIGGIEQQKIKEKIIRKYLPVDDINSILIHIRIKSFGPNFIFPVKCQYCGEEQEVKIKLPTLKMVEQKNPLDRISTFESVEEYPTLDNKYKKKLITVRLLYFKELQDMYSNMKDGFDAKKTSIQLLIAQQSVLKIDGKEPTADVLENLYMTDYDLIEEKHDELAGSQETDVEFKCNKCKKDGSTMLPLLDPRFFVRT